MYCSARLSGKRGGKVTGARFLFYKALLGARLERAMIMLRASLPNSGVRFAVTPNCRKS